MTPLAQLLAARHALAEAFFHDADCHVRFARWFRTERIRRKIRLNQMARRLGYTSTMLMPLERGKRRWSTEKAQLAVKLLTRRDNWPD